MISIFHNCIKIISISLFLVIIIFPLDKSYGKSICESAWSNIIEENEIEDIYKPLIGVCGDKLRDMLFDIVKDNEYKSYKDARREMFSNLDNEDGIVCSVYSERCINTSDIPDPNIMNCEHSWPQSLGATGIAKSDLHHLYPVMAKMNSRRSNHPFCEVKYPSYEQYGSKLGESESESGVICFEPPDFHKGNLARAMFYFSLRYKKEIDTDQEFYFRKWNALDDIDNAEIYRNNQIERFQKNRNPFIDHPEFIELIYDF